MATGVASAALTARPRKMAVMDLKCIVAELCALLLVVLLNRSQW